MNSTGKVRSAVCWTTRGLVGKKHIRLSFIHQAGELRHPRAELIGDLAPLFACGLSVVLSECGADPGRDDAAMTFTGVRQGVAHEMHPAALPGDVQHAGYRGFQPFVGIGDHQLDAAQPTTGQAAQELDPECFRFAGADCEAEHFTSAVTVHGNRHSDGNRNNAPLLAHFHICRIQPKIRPFAFNWPVQERLHALVDLAAEPADLALGDPGAPSAAIPAASPPEPWAAPPIACTRSSTLRVEMPCT